MSNKRPPVSDPFSPSVPNEDPPAQPSSSTSRPGSNTAAAAGSIRSADYHVPRREDKKLPKAQGIQRTASGRAIKEGVAASTATLGHADYPHPPLTGETVVLVPDSQFPAVPSSHPEEDEDVYGFGSALGKDWSESHEHDNDEDMDDEQRTERADSPVREQTPAVSIGSLGLSELLTPEPEAAPTPGAIYARRVSWDECRNNIPGFDEDWAVSAAAQSLSNVRYLLESGLLDFKANAKKWVDNFEGTSDKELHDHVSFRLVREYVALAAVIEDSGCAQHSKLFNDEFARSIDISVRRRAALTQKIFDMSRGEVEHDQGVMKGLEQARIASNGMSKTIVSMADVIHVLGESNSNLKKTVTELSSTVANLVKVNGGVEQNTVDIKATLRQLGQEVSKFQVQASAGTSYAGRAASGANPQSAGPSSQAQPTKDPRKQPAEAGDKEAPQKGAPKDKDTAPPAPKKARGAEEGEIVDEWKFDTKADWARLRAAATIGELAPTVQLSEASAIAAGLGLATLGSAGNPITLGSIQGSQPAQAPKAITAAGEKKQEERPKKPLPKVTHVNHAGSPGAATRTVVVRSSQAFAAAVPSITEEEILEWARMGLGSGTLIVAKSCNFKKSGYDAQIVCTERLLDTEVIAIRDYLVDKFKTRLVGATIAVAHAERLTRVALKQFHKYRNDPLTGKSSAKYGVWAPHEVYAELRKQAANDAHTKAFVDALLPCYQSPIAEFSGGAGGSGLWICYIRDTVSGSASYKLCRNKVKFDGRALPLERLNAVNAEVPCTKCWRWGHTSGQCGAYADACPLCGGAHLETEHAKFALCCASVGLKGGVVPDVCPDAHYC